MYAFYHYDNFLDGLLFCISLGEDADTVGAVYGQIAGAYYGLEAIPKYLIDGLVNSSFIIQLAKELIFLSKKL